MLPMAPAATGWGPSTTRPHAWPVMAREHRAAPGRGTRTSSSSRRVSRARRRPRIWIGSIPVFATGAAPSSTDMGRIPGMAHGGGGSTTPNATTRQTPARIRSNARIRGAQKQTTPNQRLHDRSTSLQPADGVNLTVSQRNTPALFGAGRIDAIPSDVLVAVAAHQPAEIRGKVSRTPDGQVGRFGWKAQIASLGEFIRAACANELGLEVPGHSQAASPLAPSQKAKGLDMTEAECDDLVAYLRALPAPVAIDPSGSQGTRGLREGRRLFADVGCADCHVPSLGNVRGIYSDLLLHDLGPSLGDSGSYYGFEGPISPGAATAQEWRTPPLWGYRDSGPYLHDGRAEDLEEAVALHGGQALGSNAPVLRPLRGGSVPDRGVPEIAGRALGDCCAGSGPRGRVGGRIRAGGGAYSREPRPAAMGRGRGPRPDATT